MSRIQQTLSGMLRASWLYLLVVLTMLFLVLPLSLIHI